jgi:hypothetical protein
MLRRCIHSALNLATIHLPLYAGLAQTSGSVSAFLVISISQI